MSVYLQRICLFCILLQIHARVQDSAVLNVIDLTMVKIAAPLKRLQTKTQVYVTSLYCANHVSDSTSVCFALFNTLSECVMDFVSTL